MTGSADVRSIGERFEAIVRRLGDKAALVGDGRILDFTTLESTTRAIAARIVTTADGRPGFVPLLVGKKTLGVQAMLASVRCGRAYVPLDAGDPDERLRFIVRDCAPVVLLAERGMGERALALAEGRCPVVEIDGDEKPDPAWTLPSVSADALAYLLYTSGSTGTPKGVTQTQANVAYFVDAYARRAGMSDRDRISLIFSLAFSASNLHVWGFIMYGATAYAYDMRRDGIPGLAGWLNRERITVLCAIPTVIRGLFASLRPGEKLAHVRAILFGGEATYTSDARAFLEHTNDDAIFVNQLAATEADIVTQYVVTHRDPLPTTPILPVGRPHAGVEVRIRRDDGGDAAPDEVGAIVVSCVHVSPGYWRRPDLDAQHLPPDPRHPGRRCYVGGDRGRIDAEGLVHYIGRAGSRVKIHGHSVDVSEVEAALATMPGVRRCAVLASAPEPGKEADRIVAFVSTSTAKDGEGATLRQRLADRLPPYMLPSVFVRLDGIPSTSTGKVDRVALAGLDPPRELVAGGAGPAPDDLELAVAGIFERILKRAGVGSADDFFLLGGDSLLLPELQNRLRDTFGVDLVQLHRNATVAGIAAAIRHQRATSRGAAPPMPMLIPLRESGTRTPLFLIHGRLGQALTSAQFLDLLDDDQPVWAFRLRGLDGTEPPHDTLEAMAADYAAAIRRVRPRGPYLIGSFCIGAFVAMEVARLLRAAGETVLPLLLIDPPPTPFAMDERDVSESRMLDRLRRQQKYGSGRGTAPTDDPAVLNDAVRAARAFELAISSYKPRAYDGHVCMLLSESRLARAPRTQWRKVYAGEISRFMIGETHARAMRVDNPLFASALVSSMKRIYAAVPP